jgi:transglutaminase-like putative cysteine protease
MKMALVSFFVAAGFSSMLAHAQRPGFTPNITVLSDDITYDVKADGTYTKEETETYRLNSDQALTELGQISLRYSPSMQELQVEEAYSTTADGKRVDVTRDRILDRQSKESADAPLFDDDHIKTVVFPDLRVGSTVTWKERLTQRTPLFPGQFSSVEYFYKEREYKSVKVKVSVPETTRLQVDAQGMKGGREATNEQGKQVWQWTLEDSAAHPPELGSVGAIDYSPRVAFSTFADYATVGKAYQLRALPKAAVTPAIRKLADQITAGISDPKSQATAIYNWVSRNIRYVAVYIGSGTVVPHDADTILSARYGDCKDHVTLLQALLAAKGIRSSPVLVNTRTSYWLPQAATPLPTFNHAITYLPDFKLFADSTASVARFGDLPFVEMGKPALVTDDGSGDPIVTTLPSGDPSSLQNEIVTHVTVDDSGDARGSSTITPSGAFDWFARRWLSSLRPGVEPQLASRLMAATGQNGTGEYRHGDTHDLNQPFTYSTTFQLPGYAQFPGPGAMQVPVGPSGLSNIASLFKAFGPATRDYAMPMPGLRMTETTIVALPPDLKVSNLPNPVAISSPLGSYTSRYALLGNTVTITRELVITTQGGLLQPGQYPELRKLMLDTMRDLHGQIIY